MESKKLTLKGMIYASMFGAATAAGAYVLIPFPLVPITLQTLFLNLAAGLLGARLAALSQVLYLLLGVIGLPVFAGGKAGMGVLFGPTGGYLFGFVAAAYVIGKLVESKRSPGSAWMLFSMGIGAVVIYVFGLTQLVLIAKLTIGKAVSVGMVPFLIGDGVKIFVAAMVAVRVKERGSLRLETSG